MTPALFLIITILVVFFLFDSWMNWLNLQAADPKIPEEFVGVYEEDAYAKSQQSLRDHTWFDIYSGAIKTTGLILFMTLGGFAWVYELAAEVSGSLIVQGLGFAGVLTLVGTLCSIPFQLYNTFVLEARYGFNKTTPKTFVLDQVKGLLLTALIGGPVFAVLILFFDKAGGNAWWISWVALTVIQLVLMYIAPTLILPLFNKFEPLEEGELRTRVEDYASNQGFQLSGLFKIDGSRRSTRANAYFTGFGKTRRIALYDTLIQNHTIDELVAILAHEVGHAKCKHVNKQLAGGILSTGMMLFILSLVIERPWLYEAFGLPTEPVLPIYAGFFFFGFLYTPISTALGILTNIMSRKFEFEADAFAATTTGDPMPLITGLKSLSVDNLSNLTPHPWLVFIEYSHPPVIQRIEHLKKFLPSENSSH